MIRADDLSLIGESLIDIDNEKTKVDPVRFMSYISSKIKDQNIYYLLLDEAQNLGSFEPVLNGYLRKENLDIYVTSSNSKFLSSDVITEFEGREMRYMFYRYHLKSFIKCIMAKLMWRLMNIFFIEDCLRYVL